MNASQNSGSSIQQALPYANLSISTGISCIFFCWSCGKPEGFLFSRVFWGELEYHKENEWSKKRTWKSRICCVHPQHFFLFRIWVHDPIIFGCGIQIGFHELRTIRLLAANGLQGLPGFCSFQRLKNDFPTEQPVEQESKRTEFFSSNKSQNIWSLEPPGRFFGQIFDWRERQSVEMAGARMLWSSRWTTHHILAESLEIWTYLGMNILPASN